ncbi:MAG: putative 2-aminoethylphosphonate ABC transporter permease subunit [SAR324 cluster bacterium]|nr:putative 2-aminoethylphosphonate ABC transporter permease subunit [SAR324 cluster bacterium]MEC9360355.1 putative 2-aminoethylphosphonate ABC transporter permease subunit [SAR324 cluster bacterium]MED5240824.1 putative 2-aminoethylphosphonate ABC transporter permease subunit [SAR324 cluster bacterium]MED5515991.1 putative 2-aminoethylphosphonate ABC transporter permease subunit [SAR324 cluster bacterium]MED6339092.1 putative 2-aminoethylphosphonate ABC transporter permease subunit [SAR324 cl
MSSAAALPVSVSSTARIRISRDDITLRSGLVLLITLLVIAVVFPLYSLLSKSFEDMDGKFVGLQNFREYFETPALFTSITNSLGVAISVALIVLVLAFIYAYALTRTKMPLRGLFRGIALIPILAPSLLAAISLIYWFGNQGVLKSWLLGSSIYGPIGVIMASCFWVFPHALMILITALSTSDARLYEAAEALRTPKWRVFWTVTLPGAKYGILSTGFIVFTLVITDFGVPKVIGGRFNVLATDVYKQVVGQQNFEMGAVVSLVLLLPAVVAFIADRWVQRKQVALLSARAVPFQPKADPVRDWLLFAFCAIIAFIFIAMLAMAAYASFVTFWPYNLSLSLKNYDFDVMDGGGWEAYYNSIRLAIYCAVFGSGLIFLGSYLVEKVRGIMWLRNILHLSAMLPLAVPGLVLGIAYIFFFNHPNNPLGFLYGTMGILVICTITHFYTVSHLTCLTALKQLDPEFEGVAISLKTPVWRTFGKVTLPVCLPALLDVGSYLFLNAMTTVSAVVFLYSPETMLASVAVLNMDDAGDIAPAAAMAMMIVYTSAFFRILHAIFSNYLKRRTQIWRSQ